MEWYVLTIAALCAVAFIVGLAAGQRLAWASLILLANYALCSASIIGGANPVQAKVIASALDIAALCAVLHALRAFPCSSGLHLAGGAMVLSLVSHWAAHVATGLHGLEVTGPYFVTTNSAMAVAALGLIWAGLLRWGACHGMAGWLPDPLGWNGAWRVPVGAASKAARP